MRNSKKIKIEPLSVITHMFTLQRKSLPPHVCLTHIITSFLTMVAQESGAPLNKKNVAKLYICCVLKCNINLRDT